MSEGKQWRGQFLPQGWSWRLRGEVAHLLLVTLSLVPALLPLARPGFFVSDDGRFHVYRLAALADAWQQGVLHPRLFPEFGFGYGQAVLNFYSPLSYWPGALLAGLGFDPATAAQFTIALGFWLAAYAAYGYVRSLWGPHAGLAAAVVYTYFPYHLADAYTRGALPEHFAFLFPPLILWAYTAAFRNRYPLPALLWGALAWAGLVLTHNLTALLMVLVGVPHLLFLAAWTRRWSRLAPAAGSLLLAIALSAAYWLPVLAESTSIGIGAGPSRGYENHLLAPGQILLRSPVYLYRDANNLQLVYPLSWLSLGLLLGTLLLLLWRWRKDRMPGPVSPLLFHLALAAGAVIMTTTLALPLWGPLTPVLGHLQYPWRFLAVAALGLMGAAGALPRLGPRLYPALWIGSLLIAFLGVSLPRLPLEPLALPAAELARADSGWSPERMWREDAEAGQVGATWTGEFLPVTVLEQRWALGRSPAEPASSPPLEPPPAVQIARLAYAAIDLQVETSTGFSLRLHQFAQPGWTAEVDGRPAPVYPSGELGLATVDLPPGQYQVHLVYGPTVARTAGAVVSTVGVLGWILLAWWYTGKRPLGTATAAPEPGGPREQGPRMMAVVLCAVTLSLSLNSLGIGQKVRVPIPHQARLEDVALLVAHEAHPVHGARALDVTLYWFALREVTTNFKAFVHLVDGQGAVVGQHDGDPVGGFTPTTRWRKGEIIADRHRIALPEGIQDGDLGLKAGLYEPETVGNLTVKPATPDNRINLGTLALP